MKKNVCSVCQFLLFLQEDTFLHVSGMKILLKFPCDGWKCSKFVAKSSVLCKIDASAISQ